MKGAFFIYLQLVTFLYFENCSSIQTGQCSQSNGKIATQKEDEITEVLKECAVSATNLTKYFDRCFKDYEVCLTDLNCLSDKSCLRSKQCKTPEDEFGTTVGTEDLWKHMGKLLDVCDVNATQLANEMNECIQSKLCPTDELMKTIYQNISLYMCNISNGFYKLSWEILQTYSVGADEREKTCKESNPNRDNEATSSDDRKIEDCRINATGVCEKLEQCIEKYNSLPESLANCEIYPQKLINESEDCVEKIKCLTHENYIWWRVNTSTHLYHVSGGFGHLSTAFWEISEQYGAQQSPERNGGKRRQGRRRNNKNWKCVLAQVPVNPTSERFDKDEFYAKFNEKSFQARYLVSG